MWIARRVVAVSTTTTSKDLIRGVVRATAKQYHAPRLLNVIHHAASKSAHFSRTIQSPLATFNRGEQQIRSISSFKPQTHLLRNSNSLLSSSLLHSIRGTNVATTTSFNAQQERWYSQPSLNLGGGGLLSGLSNKMSDVFATLTRKKNLTAKDVEDALKEVRVALIEADVALPVVKQFIADVTEEAIGTKIVGRDVLPKAATVYEIVKSKLQALLGGDDSTSALKLRPDGELTVISVVGIQGSGKTTTCAKLASRLQDIDKKKVLLVSLDTYRPAAQEQLERLANQINVASLSIIPGQTPQQIAERAMQMAKDLHFDVVLFDTAGRMHIDEELMQEVKEIHGIINPDETLLVADAMLGNDAVNISREFHQKIGVSGIILTRLDGDARGGAAISMRQITGVPIKFVGVGEKLPDLDRFTPSGMASRILGGGDIDALAEKARQIMQANEEELLRQRMAAGIFDLNDYLMHIKNFSRMGSIQSMLSYLPSSMNTPQMQSMMNLVAAKFTPQLIATQIAILEAMTEEERRNPELTKSSSTRKTKLAAAAKVQMIEVNRLFKMYEEMGKLMPAMNAAMKGNFKMPTSIQEALNNPLLKGLIKKQRVFKQR